MFGGLDRVKHVSWTPKARF